MSDRPGSEPYRYRCRNCGSAAVTTTTSCTRKRGATFAANGRGQQAAAASSCKPYRCNRCGERDTHVFDMKETRTARPDSP